MQTILLATIAFIALSSARIGFHTCAGAGPPAGPRPESTHREDPRHLDEDRALELLFLGCLTRDLRACTLAYEAMERDAAFDNWELFEAVGDRLSALRGLVAGCAQGIDWACSALARPPLTKSEAWTP